ncbi:serine hydrolase domain-containing protein [Aquirufa sp. KTFRIE-69F]|uniref:Serine hydrolase domain-containing protein n=1 Tax=Aquirufa originis TaxID=3096514 RepID=A0ABW6DBH0_9BACT
MKKLLFCLVAATFSLSAQTNEEKIHSFIPTLDSLFKQQANLSKMPGLVYGIVYNGRLIHSNALGLAQIENGVKADKMIDFRIASMSKSFASMAILQLRDAGKLRLDDPAANYIPELKSTKSLTKDAPVITIRHLLTHAAGFPEDNPWGDRQLGISDETFKAMIKKGITFSTNPGISYEYSNMGFAMLGLIIKNVSGQSYQSYIQEHIFKPLGMNNTYWEYSEVPANKLAYGYRWLDNKWVKQPMEHDGAYGAMGGLITTLEDFSKYTALHLSAWPERDETEKGPLKRSSLREMQFPWNISGFNPKYTYPIGRIGSSFTSYGYGLSFLQDDQGRRSVGHSGGLPGFGSNWRIYPDYDLGIISFANVTYAPASFINLKVLDSLISSTQLSPRKLPASAILKQRQSELVRLLPEWKNATETGIFAENFFLDYFPEKLAAEAKAIFGKIGAIRSIQEIEPENNLRGTFRIDGEKGSAKVYFTLSPETPALIQEYHIQEIKKAHN